MKCEIVFFYYHADRMNLAAQLADALRAVMQFEQRITASPHDGGKTIAAQAREALAAYDAQQSQPVSGLMSQELDRAFKHAPEPWIVEGTAGTVISADLRGKRTINNAANARRIVACVNACAGIPTNELEGAHFAGAVRKAPHA